MPCSSPPRPLSPITRTIGSTRFTADKELAFEPTDRRRLPAADLRTSAGYARALADLADRIVVLSFVPGACGEPCTPQQALLTEVLEAVNITPMRDMVTFVTVAAAGAERETHGSPRTP